MLNVFNNVIKVIKDFRRSFWFGSTALKNSPYEEQSKYMQLLYFFFIFTLFCFTILYWFCHRLTWISHRCTWVPKHEPPPHLPPYSISLDHPRAPAPNILCPVSNIDWWFVSYMIVYMFQCHSPKSSHPLPLPQSPKVHSTSDLNIQRQICWIT